MIYAFAVICYCMMRYDVIYLRVLTTNFSITRIKQRMSSTVLSLAAAQCETTPTPPGNIKATYLPSQPSIGA